MDKCQCTFAQKMQGDGCRYCNPQEYIDRLHDQLKEMEYSIAIKDNALEAAGGFIRKMERMFDPQRNCDLLSDEVQKAIDT